MEEIYFVCLKSDSDFERLLNEVRKRQRVQFFINSSNHEVFRLKIDVFLERVAIGERFEIETSPVPGAYFILSRHKVDLVV